MVPMVLFNSYPVGAPNYGEFMVYYDYDGPGNDIQNILQV